MSASSGPPASTHPKEMGMWDYLDQIEVASGLDVTVLPAAVMR
jgi:hypothetical protein